MSAHSLRAGGLFALAALSLTPVPALAQNAGDLGQKLESLERQIQALKQQIKDTDAKAETAVEALERGGAADGGSGPWARTTIGGYGELHYNSAPTNRIDFHRFVLFFGHRFNDWISFHSELELEHALSGGAPDGKDGKPGEVELEQAYIDFALTSALNVKAGVMLMPVGLLNEIHEPNTFYGVERNAVEKNIIPTTWWEAGVMSSYNFSNGLGVDAMFSSGLKVNNNNEFAVRGGRQKVANADAHDGAFTGRVRWSGMPGVYLSGVVQYQTDLLQSQVKDSSTHAWLTNVNADLQKGPFGLRALWARWDIAGNAAKDAGKDKQWGFYVEPSYRHVLSEKWGDVGVFYRYSLLDVTAGEKNKEGTEEIHHQVGLNYWPTPNVVLKADYDRRTDGDRNGIFNLGLGYQF